MFTGLINSKMRVQILMRFFLNPDSRAHLRELSNEFKASPGHLRSELQQLTKAGLLASEKDGRQVKYSAVRSHPLFPELHSMVRKALGMDRILDSIIQRLGKLEAAYLTGDYAQGRDTGIVDLVLVGDIDRRNLLDLTAKTEHHLQRRIRTLVVDVEEFDALREKLEEQELLLLWHAAAPPDQNERGFSS
ncbi:MAG: winged helix-turn-helix transcriptional regulator [Gammaproteobacteria bacterium]|nr:winged helix-turn-helix transcriptional regulator [Gammaproteobacteria bacterium]